MCTFFNFNKKELVKVNTIGGSIDKKNVEKKYGVYVYHSTYIYTVTVIFIF